MPCNCDVYPSTRFHVKLLNSCKTWIENGSEDLSAKQLDELSKKKNATLEDIPLDIGMCNETSTGFYQGEKGKFVRHFIID